jgi:hypothetical protein
MEATAAGEEPDAPGHADERLGDAIMLAVLLFAFCAYWLLSRKPQGLWARQEERGRERQGDNTSGANEVYVRAAAHVAQDYWDRYDKAQGWSSSIAPSSKTKSVFEGGKSFKGANRPLDVGCPPHLPVLEHVFSNAPAYALTLRDTLVVGPSAAPNICPEATQLGRQRRSRWWTQAQLIEF